MRDSFGFAGDDLSGHLTESDFIEAHEIAAAVTRENFLDLEIFNVPVGRLALYELIIDHKKQDLKFTEPEWQAYQVALNHVVLTIRAVDRLFVRHRPDHCRRIQRALLGKPHML